MPSRRQSTPPRTTLLHPAKFQRHSLENTSSCLAEYFYAQVPPPLLSI